MFVDSFGYYLSACSLFSNNLVLVCLLKAIDLSAFSLFSNVLLLVCSKPLIKSVSFIIDTFFSDCKFYSITLTTCQ